MPRSDYRRCRVCNRPSSEVGPLTHTRLCLEDAKAIQAANNEQIHLKSGPYYERRRYGIAVREFGPRIALALKQAGVFDPDPVDTPAPSP